MRSLTFIIALLGWMVSLLAQNPHGDDFKMNCAACHTSDSWEITVDSWNFERNPEIKISQTTGWVIGADSLKFNHFDTNFPLEGQHGSVDCRECHTALVFKEASTECISCHTDIHQMTVGSDCVRCHNVENWLVDNITQLHQDNGFPLLGVHAQISCTECHESNTNLAFNRIGNECINCHLKDFNATTDPNHLTSGFSLECTDCHKIEGFDWSSEFINHSFFPLTKGHDIADCAACHVNGQFKNTPTDCVACHQTDYDNAQNPNHQTAAFSTNCIDCHTIDIEWMPAEYVEHDNFFPIYSGKHQGEWDACMDCHLNPNDFSEFTCTTCHTNPETDNEHREVNGYVYEDRACLACHPTGNEADNFDHNRTRFPLRGAHSGLDCLECHNNGYAGTPTDCAACHIENFNQTTAPNHQVSGFSTECQNCHTEDAWQPAFFDHENTNFPLRGAHITTDCIECHTDGYAGTPTDCAACHTEEYNQTTTPNHQSAGFSTDCKNCHTEDAWEPAFFNHENTNFPLRGAHAMVDCIECHADGYEGTPTDCSACHIDDYNQTTNPNHKASGFNTDCQICHGETAWIPATFDHNETNFPLTGAHITVDCIECHADGYVGTPTDCAACHQEDFNQSTNPNHPSLGLSNDCVSCHTTAPDWMPAKFDIHNQFYELKGAHATIANDCAACHNGDYNNTPNTCFGCHANDYNQAGNPNHRSAGFPTDCESCHNESRWEPADFNHDAMYFPIYSGKHKGEWGQCIECHTMPGDFKAFSCIDCHEHNDPNELRDDHDDVNGYKYESSACYSCHPTGEE